MIKKLFILCLKIVIAIITVWYLFYSKRLTTDIFPQLVNPANISLLMLSGTAFLAAQTLASYRLALFLKTINQQLSFTNVFKLTMIGSFFNIAIPGMVGGDIVKGIYLFKNEEDRRGRSSGIILMDRVMGFMALLFIGIVSIINLYLFKKVMLLPYVKELNLILLISIASLTFFALFVIFSKKRRFRMKAEAIASTLFKKKIFYNMIDAIGSLTKHRQVLIYAFFISLGIQVISMFGMLILIRLIPGNLPDIMALIAASSVVLLFGIIPVTPGNIGWTELIASIGWSVVGSTAGGIIFFYWRIVSILFSLPGGLLYLLPGNDILWRHAEATDPGETAQK